MPKFATGLVIPITYSKIISGQQEHVDAYVGFIDVGKVFSILIQMLNYKRFQNSYVR